MYLVALGAMLQKFITVIIDPTAVAPGQLLPQGQILFSAFEVPYISASLLYPVSAVYKTYIK